MKDSILFWNAVAQWRSKLIALVIAIGKINFVQTTTIIVHFDISAAKPVVGSSSGPRTRTRSLP